MHLWYFRVRVQRITTRFFSR